MDNLNDNGHVLVYAGRYELQFRRPDGTRYYVAVPLNWEKPQPIERKEIR